MRNKRRVLRCLETAAGYRHVPQIAVFQNYRFFVSALIIVLFLIFLVVPFLFGHLPPPSPLHRV